MMPMSMNTSPQRQLHEGPLTCKQSSSYELFCFDVFIIVSVTVIFLVVHLHHDHLVTTFKLSHFN